MQPDDKPLPRFFRHTKTPESDCVYVRHDSDGPLGTVIVTPTGERPPTLEGWVLADTLQMVSIGRAIEITAHSASCFLAKSLKLTPEQQKERTRQKNNARVKRYAAKHPERVKAAKKISDAKRLRRLGFKPRRKLGEPAEPRPRAPRKQGPRGPYKPRAPKSEEVTEVVKLERLDSLRERFMAWRKRQ